METDVLERPNSIAVIGMAGRFPGARTLDQYWRNIAEGVESITFFSDDELLEAGVDSGLLKNPGYVKAAPLLDDVDQFDARFFQMSPREAEITDPQHRIFLECAWEALEHAGYAGEGYDGAIGVFAGSGGVMSTYLLSEYHIHHKLISPSGSREHVGNDKDYLSTRVSYKLNLRGPSFTVQCACSTSLVAVHLACQSLLLGESDIALAGGVTVRIPQKVGYLQHDNVVSSPDGHCRAFDADAQGTIFGSGVGLVVLKPLAAAVADGDVIHAVIRGSAINNDGASKISYWASSAEGQVPAMIEALTIAEVNPETIGYVEAHGTGTSLGDPVEVFALTRAFRHSTERTGYCAIGSVKPNVGHLDAASGVASLIKAILVLENKTLPPSVHFRTPNPRIDFAVSPFYVNTEKKPWKADRAVRRAAVNALGIGGTNAFVVLEEAPAPPRVEPAADRPTHVLTISAKSQKALKESARRHERYFEDHPNASLGDVCFTAGVGRAQLPFRLAVVAGSVAEARRKLGRFNTAQPAEQVTSGKAAGRGLLKVAFLFTGEGPQYAGMGRRLYQSQPSFREIVERADELVRPVLGQSLLSVLNPESSDAASTADPAILDSALFALEYALARLWRSWGIEPMAVMGEGVGQYAAACTAGVFRLADGLAMVAERARLVRSLPADAPQEAIARQFEACCREVAFSAPQIDVISSTCGRPAGDAIAAPEYWAGQLGRPGQVAEAIAALDRQGANAFLEIGPEPILLEKGRESLPGASRLWLASLRQGRDDWSGLLESLAELFVHGAAVRWRDFDSDYPRRRVVLPTYPFQRKRFWVETMPADASAELPLAAKGKSPTHPMLGHRLPLAGKEIVFQSEIRANGPAFLEDHRIGGMTLLPAGVYLEMALSAGQVVSPAGGPIIENVTIRDALSLPPRQARTVQLVLGPNQPGGYSFDVFSRENGTSDEPSWTRHAAGSLLAQSPPNPNPATADLPAIQAECSQEISVDQYYQRCWDRGIHYGPRFRVIRRLWRGGREALGEIRLPDSLSDEAERYRLHPVLLDACFQVVRVLLHTAAEDGIALPVAVRRVEMLRPGRRDMWCHARTGADQDARQDPWTADAHLLTPDGQVIAVMEGIRVQRRDNGK